MTAPAKITILLALIVVIVQGKRPSPSVYDYYDYLDIPRAASRSDSDTPAQFLPRAPRFQPNRAHFKPNPARFKSNPAPFKPSPQYHPSYKSVSPAAPHKPKLSYRPHGKPQSPIQPKREQYRPNPSQESLFPAQASLKVAHDRIKPIFKPDFSPKKPEERWSLYERAESEDSPHFYSPHEEEEEDSVLVPVIEDYSGFEGSRDGPYHPQYQEETFNPIYEGEEAERTPLRPDQQRRKYQDESLRGYVAAPQRPLYQEDDPYYPQYKEEIISGVPQYQEEYDEAYEGGIYRQTQKDDRIRSQNDVPPSSVGPSFAEVTDRPQRNAAYEERRRREEEEDEEERRRRWKEETVKEKREIIHDGGHLDANGKEFVAEAAKVESGQGDGRLAFQIHGQSGPHSYRFGYDTGKGYNRQFRYEERGADGQVHGRYGFYDKDGKLQIVNYSAHPKHGFSADVPHP